MGETDCGGNWVLFRWVATLRKSLIQFSVDRQGCVSSVLFNLEASLSAPTLHQATVDPHLHQRFLDTHRKAWVSLLWGHFSFLLGPGVHKLFFVPSKSLAVLWWG